MPNLPVSGLTAASSLTGSELLYTVQGGADRKATVTQIQQFIDGRIVIPGNLDFYVASTGSNLNSGSVASPWATIQYAADTIATTYDFNGFTITIHVAAAAGAYVGVTLGKFYNSSSTPANLYFLGDETTPSNVQIAGEAGGVAGAFSGGFSLINAVTVWVNGFRFVNTVGPCLAADTGSQFNLGNPTALTGNLEFANCGANAALIAGNVRDISGSGGMNVATILSSLFTNPIGACIATLHECQIVLIQMACTITGTPAFTVGALTVQEGDSFVQMYSGIFGGGVSAATGPKFYINVPGGDTGFIQLLSPKETLPGNVPGTLINGSLTDSNGTYYGVGGATMTSNVNYQAPLTGFSLTLGNFDSYAIIDSTSALSSGTIQMCPLPSDGQHINIRFSQPITALAITANTSQTIVGAPSSANAGSVLDGLWHSSTKTWYF